MPAQELLESAQNRQDWPETRSPNVQIVHTGVQSPAIPADPGLDSQYIRNQMHLRIPAFQNLT